MEDGFQLGRVKLQLFGVFSVAGPDGTDLTPASLKSQALLALLVTAQNHHRTRPWLQDKLWSLSDPEHGASSLRQALATIRRSLGPFRELLKSNRHKVWLDSDRFRTDWNEDPDSRLTAFLEGIDINDPEFSEWLQRLRNRHSTPATPSACRLGASSGFRRWKVVMTRSAATSAVSQLLEQEFLSLLSKSLHEMELAEISEKNEDPKDQNTFEVCVSASMIDDVNCGFRASVIRSQSNRVLWSETKTISAVVGQIEANFPLITLAHMIQSAIIREMSFASDVTPGIDSRALILSKSTPRIFSFDADELEAIDRKLLEITDGPEHAIALAWRTQVSVIRDIEQLAPCTDDLAEEGMGLAQKAIEADPMNSLVLSAAANAHVFLDWDITTGAELARLAIRINPSNPLAWWAYTNVALYSEDAEKALKSAKIAAQLAQNSPLRFWCKFQLGLAALQNGDLELAKRSLEASAAIAPKFRPPRRYLLAIYAHLGQLDRAAKMAESLGKLERDFSLDRYLRDDSYPISLARRMILFDPTAIAELE